MSGRILVVEDSRTQAEALRALLAEHGYRVEVVLDGDAALRRASEIEFDLVLSDILMPGVCGYDLCRRLKDAPELYGSPHVVLLTGLGDPVDIVRGLECGADNYLTKPYRPERLVARIAQILDEQRTRRVRTADGAVTLTFLGNEFTIHARRAKVLDFFLSSFEELIETNRALQESEQELQKTLAREKAARRAAEAATAARDTVLATVSHDLRNPLNTILMSAGMLLEFGKDRLDEMGRERVAVIRRLAHEMNRLIQDLLDVATADAGHLVMDAQTHDAGDICRDGLEMLEPIAAENGLRIVTRLPDDLPAIDVDRSRVLQVISNLVGNAIKFTPAGGTITIEAWVESAEIVYRVSDTGPGIPEEHLPRIFDRFWKNGSREMRGAGLGLAIAREIVEAHGGRIWAESEPGQGATFLFTIPLEAGVGRRALGVGELRDR